MKTKKYVKWYNSLAFRLTVLVIPLALIPLFIVSYYNYVDSTDRIKHRAYSDIRENTVLQKKFLLNWFHYREIDIKNISQQSNTVSLMQNLNEGFEKSKQALDKYVCSDEHFVSTIMPGAELLKFQHDYDYAYDLFLIDLEGNILYTNEQESDLGTSLLSGVYKNTRFGDAFRATLEDKKIHFSDLELYAPSDGTVAGFLTAPIIDENGVNIGVFAIQIKLDKISALFQEHRFAKNETVQTYIVGVDSYLRTPINGDKSKILKMKIHTKQFEHWQNEHKQYDGKDYTNDENIISYDDPFAKRVFGLHQDIHILGTTWVLISERSVSIIEDIKDEIIKKTAIIASMLLLLIVALSAILAKYLVRPILHLVELVKKFEDGKRNIKIDLDSKNELGVLASYFSDMVRTIKDNEQQLDEQKFALNAHSIVAITDIGGYITYVNSKFEKISGYTQAELIGQNHRILNSGDKPKEYWKNMYADISSGKTWKDEIKNITKDGETYWVDTTIVPFMDAEGKIKSYVAIRTDITQKKQDEFELIEAKIKADEGVKVKAEFFASMSHEIRTPMNGIIGMLGLLLKTDLNETQNHQAYLAQTSANALLSLINDILDFSKFEADKLELEEREFNIHNEFGDLAEALAFKAQDKGVDIVLDTKDVEFKTIVADAHRIKQILNNLVSNAIKFTQNGYVLISVSLVPQGEDKARLFISVEDTGLGIPKNKLSTLFDSFSQVDSSTTRQYGGTGLGLAIVKQLVELMDGSVEVSSQEGKGSIFSINISVKLDVNAKKSFPDVAVKDKRVLIVDTSEKSAQILALQLRKWGMKVDLDQKSDAEYELIFIAKRENSLEFGKSLKEIHTKAKLVLMTSLADTANVSEYIESIYDTYYPQPATINDICKALNTLEDVYNSYERNKEENATPDEEFNPKTKILLVDDNKVNQLVALGLLEEFALDADVANNGLEAIKAVEEAGNEPYEIILMDCQMPEMDGYDATKALKSGKYGQDVRKTPIVAMTANAMEGDKEKCFASGMDDYISKPIDPERLEEVLRKYLL